MTKKSKKILCILIFLCIFTRLKGQEYRFPVGIESDTIKRTCRCPNEVLVIKYFESTNSLYHVIEPVNTSYYDVLPKDVLLNSCVITYESSDKNFMFYDGTTLVTKKNHITLIKELNSSQNK